MYVMMHLPHSCFLLCNDRSPIVKHTTENFRQNRNLGFLPVGVCGIIMNEETAEATLFRMFFLSLGFYSQMKEFHWCAKRLLQNVSLLSSLKMANNNKNALSHIKGEDNNHVLCSCLLASHISICRRVTMTQYCGSRFYKKDAQI